MCHHIIIKDIEAKKHLGVNFTALVNREDTRRVTAKFGEFVRDFIRMEDNFFIVVLWEVGDQTSTGVTFLDFRQETRQYGQNV